ncbi:unnamed protein product [Malus baccata var. baccata]
MILDRPFLSCPAYGFLPPFPVQLVSELGTTQGLACGVFIYVSINHLLLKGYTAHMAVSIDTPHYKFLVVLFGIVVVVSVVTIWDTI